jgi:hypothetical protein
MAEYSAIKSYLEKNNLHYFAFFPNFEMPVKAVICHLPNTPVEDISSSLEDVGKVIQSSDWPYSVLHLPKLWSCLG